MWVVTILQLSHNFYLIEYNGWVYEKVCLDELSNYHNADSKLSYTHCYTQCGLIGRSLIRSTTKNFLKMWVENLILNIYI